MAKVIYHLPDGTTAEVDVEPGQSVMSGSVNNNLAGIVAECGGSCACATCHVYLADQYSDFFSAPADEEEELVAYLEGANDESRLSCQLIVGEGDHEVHIRVADSR